MTARPTGQATYPAIGPRGHRLVGRPAFEVVGEHPAGIVTVVRVERHRLQTYGLERRIDRGGELAGPCEVALLDLAENLDDVAVDFPDMPIILAHPSFPWQEEALAVATHKPQVYIDLSGWSPKYFPPILVQYANTLLKEKVLFGTDFPMLTPERWRDDLERTAIRDEIKPGL